jgi:hypothetical protein
LNNGQTTKVVVGGSGAWLGAQAGGVAYVGGFYNSAPNVAWVFPNMLGGGNTKYTADAITHESGHTFGLQHQSSYSGTSKTAEYRAGTSSLGVFMGSSYYSSRAKWSNGQSALGYNVYQDDLAVLAGSSNGFGYRTDDHGDTVGNADALLLSGADVTGSGVIERTSDIDAFSFVTSAGQVSFTLNVASFGAMLDADADAGRHQRQRRRDVRHVQPRRGHHRHGRPGLVPPAGFQQGRLRRRRSVFDHGDDRPRPQLHRAADQRDRHEWRGGRLAFVVRQRVERDRLHRPAQRRRRVDLERFDDRRPGRARLRR